MQGTTGKVALVVLDGYAESALRRIEWDQYDMHIAVDGAFDRLRSNALLPEILIGDFDSITSQSLRIAKSKGLEVIHLANQDTTDAEKAIQFLIEQSVERADLIGYRGTRLDHELAVLSAVAKESGRLSIRLIDSIAETWVLTAGQDRILEGCNGRTCSLMPLTKCENVTLTGFKWPLEEVTLEPGVMFACSNVIVEEEASIRFDNGHMLLYLHY